MAGRRLVASDPVVLAALKQAWEDSLPGTPGAHEEGGFVVRDAAGRLSVVPWPRGQQSTIGLPLHSNCRVAGNEVFASFHTHPNPGPNFLQEPSETDKRAVRDDPDLKGPDYVGELVVSQQTIYLITPGGQVEVVGDTRDLLGV
jgi:hypothetical protein